MPELPEVETIVRSLDKPLCGNKITSAQIYWSKTTLPSAAFFSKNIRGKEVLSIHRRAKYIVIILSESWYLIVHLRMSGRLLIEPPSAIPHTHARVCLELINGLVLQFRDTRKFGRMWLTQKPEEVFLGLGPEPLDAEFTLIHFINLFSNRKGTLKALLLNQRIIAGVGNIYADESCFGAGIRPSRKVQTINKSQFARLFTSLQKVLNKGIEQKGASFDSGYVGGKFQNFFEVYGREGQPCKKCGNSIVKITVAGRGTHYCPQCQK